MTELSLDIGKTILNISTVLYFSQRVCQVLKFGRGYEKAGRGFSARYSFGKQILRPIFSEVGIDQ